MIPGRVVGLAGVALLSIAPHTTWTGTLRPEPNAPNPTSLQEGELRNGRYSFLLAVRRGDQVAQASADVEVRYEQDRRRSEERTTSCRSAARARKWPDAPDTGP